MVYCAAEARLIGISAIGKQLDPANVHEREDDKGLWLSHVGRMRQIRRENVSRSREGIWERRLLVLLTNACVIIFPPGTVFLII
jgi:hypothetical protein